MPIERGNEFEGDLLWVVITGDPPPPAPLTDEEKAQFNFLLSAVYKREAGIFATLVKEGPLEGERVVLLSRKDGESISPVAVLLPISDDVRERFYGPSRFGGVEQGIAYRQEDAMKEAEDLASKQGDSTP